jgi:hypothetical protein
MDSQDKEMLNSELKNLKTLQDVAHLEGVQVLVADTKAVVVATLTTLAGSYFDKSEQELRSLCATLRANLEIYQKITGIDNQIEAIEKALE